LADKLEAQFKDLGVKVKHTALLERDQVDEQAGRALRVSGLSSFPARGSVFACTAPPGLPGGSLIPTVTGRLCRVVRAAPGELRDAVYCETHQVGPRPRPTRFLQENCT
jgi:hypothetical protein